MPELCLGSEIKAFKWPEKKLDFVYGNGGGRTRTAELRRGGIYSPLQLPLCDTPEKLKVEESLPKGPL